MKEHIKIKDHGYYFFYSQSECLLFVDSDSLDSNTALEDEAISEFLKIYNPNSEKKVEIKEKISLLKSKIKSIYEKIEEECREIVKIIEEPYIQEDYFDEEDFLEYADQEFDSHFFFKNGYVINNIPAIFRLEESMGHIYSATYEILGNKEMFKLNGQLEYLEKSLHIYEDSEMKISSTIKNIGFAKYQFLK